MHAYAAPSTWDDLRTFVLPTPRLAESASSGTFTTPYSAMHPPPFGKGPRFVDFDATLNDRISQAFARGMSSQDGGANPFPSLDFHDLGRITIRSEATVAIHFVHLRSVLRPLVEAVRRAAGKQLQTLSFEPSSMEYSQQGDGLTFIEDELEVAATPGNRARISVEFKSAPVFIDKAWSIADTRRLNAQSSAEGPDAIVIKLFLQMQSEDSRFGLLYCTYFFMIAEKVTNTRNELGLVFSEPLLATSSLPDALKKSCPAELSQGHVCLLLVAILCSDLRQFTVAPSIHDRSHPDARCMSDSRTDGTRPENANVAGHDGHGNNNHGQDGHGYNDEPSRDDAGQGHRRGVDHDDEVGGCHEAHGHGSYQSSTSLQEEPGHGLKLVTLDEQIEVVMLHPSVSDLPRLLRKITLAPASGSVMLLPSPPILAGWETESTWTMTHHNAAEISFLRQVPSPGFKLPRVSLPIDMHNAVRITLNECIGRGAVGVVWRGHATGDKLSCPVVLKMVNARHTDSVVREAAVYTAVLSQGAAPAVAPQFYGMYAVPDGAWSGLLLEDVGDAWPDNGAGFGKYAAMEYTLHMRQEIYKALRVLHSVGVKHGDLAPRNVVMTSEGVKLIDYNMAGLHDCEGSQCSELVSARAALELDMA